MYCFTADKRQDQLYLDDNTAHNILYTILFISDFWSECNLFLYVTHTIIFSWL